MTYIVDDACVKCKYTDCVDVCPVDCFLEGPEFLVIDPNGCIDCGVCEPECPAGAIKSDAHLTDKLKYWRDINAQLTKEYTPIYTKKSALPNADHWNPLLNPTIGDKKDLL
mgnify:CR=1 FL=1